MKDFYIPEVLFFIFFCVWVMTIVPIRLVKELVEDIIDSLRGWK